MYHSAGCFPSSTKHSICDLFKNLLAQCLLFCAHLGVFFLTFKFIACVLCLISHGEDGMHVIPFTPVHNIYMNPQHFIRTGKRAGN